MSSKVAGTVAIGLILALAFLFAQAVSPVAVAQDAMDDLTAHIQAEPESCATCHKDAGAKHQAGYDQLYQDGVIQISDVTYEFTAPDTSTVTFNATMNGAPFDVTQADSLGIYFAPYLDGKFEFAPAAERFSLSGELTYDGEGGVTSVVTGSPDFSAMAGLVVVYGQDGEVGRLPARIRQTQYPFAGIAEVGGGVDYVSAANNDGCVKCHTDPYLKHGYIYAQIDEDPATDFYTCKACHLDNGEGGHFEWQLLVDDPVLAAQVIAGEVELTEEQQAQYAYKTSLMNDVHMSHAMEFPYPQSMANCVTCHADKLDATLDDANFTIETCKSCHPMTGSEEYGTAELALETLMAGERHEGMDLNTEDCTDCHKSGSRTPGFREIHSGYDEVIFTADGIKYADVISVTVDSAAFDGNNLTIALSAAGNMEIDGVDPASIVPTVLVGLYGYDSKDFIIGPHERLFDDNEDGEITRDDERTLEAEVGAEHPRVTTLTAENGNWEVVADLSTWTDMIENDVVRRVEIGVMPELENADGVQLALNAPSRTFDLTTNEFVDDFYDPIVKVADGCNNCHEALATTFHSPDRGGNIVVCRLCHITKSGGSHLEMQSRSIDSYAHAIHSFQAFDIGDIDFTDPVEALHYEHHIEFPYPTHGVTDCESCHVEGTYNMPDQSKSMPGILSASDAVESWDRNIGNVPEVITGPGSRACGGCHRADLITEDAFSELVSFNQHTKQGGYMIEQNEEESVLPTVFEQIMSIFK